MLSLVCFNCFNPIFFHYSWASYKSIYFLLIRVHHACAYLITSKKKNIHFTTYMSQTFWSLWSFILYILYRFVFSLKKVTMPIFLSICIKYSKHYEMRQHNNKLNFTKNQWARWFSQGQLKISKSFISLAQLGECSKNKVTQLHGNNCINC